MQTAQEFKTMSDNMYSTLISLLWQVDIQHVEFFTRVCERAFQQLPLFALGEK